MTVLIVITVLFVVLAMLFLNGKATFLIAGYNTMPSKEREQYDIRALSRFMGAIMLALAGCLILLICGIAFDSSVFTSAGGILLIVITVFAVVYANTGNRFKQDTHAGQS